MDLYIVCILLSQLGTACLLISRAVTDEAPPHLPSRTLHVPRRNPNPNWGVQDDTKTASVTMFAVFWVTFALYTCMKLAQSTATAVRKRRPGVWGGRRGALGHGVELGRGALGQGWTG